MISSSGDIVGAEYRYCIDARDRITHVSRNWDAFALANGAPESCLSKRVLGTILWDHIHDWETGHIYRDVVANIRKSGNSATVPINCDSPELKRFIEIRIEPMDDDALQFTCRIVRLETRPSVTLIAAEVPRSDDLIRICSFCKQIDIGDDNWADTETAVVKMRLFSKPAMPGLTHTICPACISAHYAEDD